MTRDTTDLPDLEFLIVRPSWNEIALCRGKTHLFFATPGERDGRRKRREAVARAYCACCPVAGECRDAGREGREHGLWGGENEEERARAGFGATSPHRRVVAAAARESRRSSDEVQPAMASGFG